jgi:hypothetical protein
VAAVKIENAQITIVLQGGLDIGWDVRYSARHLREVLPGVKIILATQKSAAKTFEGQADFDDVVLTDDPGALPAVKTAGGPHNVNRQLLSAKAGLAAVTTPYAIKMRTDAYLTSGRAAELWSRWGEAARGDRAVGVGRILIVNLFSLNPRFDERLAYHLSDWFQFGRIEDLRAFWAGPEMDFGTNVWYESRPYAERSLPREREFRSRYATEQWLTLGYLYGKGPYPIAYHNDISPEILREFEENLADNFIVVHPSDIGLEMPKHKYVYGSRYFNTICYSFDDWKRVAKRRSGLDGTDSGWSRWPRTEVEKRFYMEAKKRLRWTRNFGWAQRIRAMLG